MTKIAFDKFKELYKNIEQTNPINMPGYEDKLKSVIKTSGENSAVTTGVASIEDYTFATFILNHEFIMGSMGTVVGEKIKKIFQYATKHKLAVIGFSASGGARMHESMFSLMQMAKTSSAVGLHDSASLLYISVLTSPTYGGVTASFAMLGDIIIAEEKAMIGFAGRNVIKELTKEELPKEFQSAEFLKEKGFIDIVVSRSKMKETLYKILSLHFKKGKD